MFFSKIGEYPPAGLFTPEHIILLIITLSFIVFALAHSSEMSKDEVKKIIRISTVTLAILEVVRIGFALTYTKPFDLNGYMPLYFCSLFLYAGIFSSFAKGFLKRMGDVFIATGGILGGLVFLIFPSTSLSLFPAFHFMSIHSFIYHGFMVYLGILVNITDYVTLKKNDLVYYATLVGVLCFICLPLNRIFGSNLMFLSDAFPGKLGRIIFQALGRFYPLLVSLFHMFVPFYFIYYVREYKKKKHIRNI